MKAAEKKNSHLFLYVPESLKLKFEKAALAKDMSLSALARSIIVEYLKNQKHKAS